MIKSFTNGSKYITAYVGSDNNPYFSMSAPSSGMIRFNGDNRNFEVYDGTGWRMMSGSSASVGMNLDAEQAISWAITKMAEERELQQLAEKNAAVKIALENVEKAKQQLQVTSKLAKQDHNSYGEMAEAQA